MDVLIAFIKLMIYIVGMWTLVKFSLVHTASRRHAVKNAGARRRAVELSDIDRYIQQNDHLLFPKLTPDEHRHLNCSICGPGPLLQGKVPSTYQHPLFKKGLQTHHDGYGGSWQVESIQAANAQTAEMVSSEVIKDGKYTGLHSIMLDIDLPATLTESSTAGHHHLYIDQTMTWKRYKRLLKALADAGVIERGYYNAAVRQGSTMLRPPWVQKPARPAPGGFVPKPVKRRVGRRKT